MARADDVTLRREEPEAVLAGLRARVARWDRVDVTAAGLSLALLVLFSRAAYLPMVDLPQHAAQLAMWIRHADPAFPEARHFEVNWHTPYLTAYALARCVAMLAGVVPALKLVVWASVVAHYVAFRWLVTLLGYPRWTALLGFVTAVGYPFYFGFVSFLVAMPIALACIGAALVHREEPALRHGLRLAALAAAALASHGFAFGLAMLFAGPLLLRGGGSLLQRLAPLSAPLLLWAVWVLPGGAVRSIGATIWDPRFVELAGLPSLFFASSSADELALALGYAALFLLATAFARPSRQLERWAPLTFLLAGFCLFPFMMSGFGPLHPRFAALIVPALLVAFEPRPASRLPGALVGALAAVWLVTFARRTAAWNDEARPLATLVDALPPHLRLRPVVFSRTSAAFPGLPALLHLTAYYQVEKGGTQGYSFAMYPTSAVRYVQGFPVGMGSGEEWEPEAFRYARERGKYDVFLVHARDDSPARLFAGHEAEIALVTRAGNWWAYRVVPGAVLTANGANPS